jgi:hypothetical protein
VQLVNCKLDEDKNGQTTLENETYINYEIIHTMLSDSTSHEILEKMAYYIERWKRAE